MHDQSHRSLLAEMTLTTPTSLWNDSCSLQELAASIETNGAVGATCNPVIVLSVLKKEMHLWNDRIPAIVREMPTASEVEVSWRLVEELSAKAAKLLEPIFERHAGKCGRLSIQTDPRLYRNARAIAEQADRFDALAPNMIVKIPVTEAGLEAIEEATWRGVSVNATVIFTVPQAVAAAEAVERGLQRREQAGKDVSRMGPVCSIMVGRLDDWLRVTAEKKGIVANPHVLDWAGVAAMKKAYAIFRRRGYRSRLLSAAFRSHLHWSSFIGGDVIISPPFEWQLRFNASGIEIRNRMNDPVDPAIVEELSRKFVDFARAYDEGGMRPAEFDVFGATRRTLRQFIKATDDMALVVRDVMIPDPER